MSSVADHGFLINIGFSQRKGFLKKNKNTNTGNFLRNRDAILCCFLLDHLKVGCHGLFQVNESSTASGNSRIIQLKMIDDTKPRRVNSFDLFIPSRNRIYLQALPPAKLPFHMLVPGLKCQVTVTKVIFVVHLTRCDRVHRVSRHVSMVSKFPTEKWKDLSIYKTFKH